MTIHRCALPLGSHIHGTLPGADFADCYQFTDRWPNLSALETYLTVAARTPGWMNTLMALRNQAVRLVGIKHLGSMPPSDADKPASAYRIGERVGIFSLQHVQPDEVILEDNDKHLRVQLSLVKHRVQGLPMVSLSTVVHIHNGLGRFYMGIVGPVHQIIVPRMLAQVVHG